MANFRLWHPEHRERQVPDVIASQTDRKRIILHQFRGSGVEIGIWRLLSDDREWVRCQEQVRLKRWEAVDLIRTLTQVMQDRDARKIRDRDDERQALNRALGATQRTHAGPGKILAPLAAVTRRDDVHGS